MRKAVLKIAISCRKCKERLIDLFKGVAGVKSVEMEGDCCCPKFIVTGDDFKLEEVMCIAERKEYCVTVVSLEETPPPPPPEPPKEEPKPEVPKPEEPKPEEPKPAEPKPAEPKPEEPKPEPAASIVEVIKPSCPGFEWPKITIPPSGNLIIMIQKLVICPGCQHEKCAC